LAERSADAIRVLSRKVMALSEDLCDLCAFDAPLLARRQAQKKRKEWISETLSKRQTFDESSHTWSDLQEDEWQYFAYFRMKQGTFEGRAIAQAVSRRLPTAAARVQTRVWSCGFL
jgi:hypothetical protein